MKGRKRHAVVDTQGWLWGVTITPANVQDKVGARAVLHQVAPLVPRLSRVWADGAYDSALLVEECAAHGWTLDITQPPPAADVEAEGVAEDTRFATTATRGRQGRGRGFRVIPKRWVVERTFSWWGQQRRLRVDYEDLPETGIAFIHLDMIGLMTRRLAHASTL